MTASLQDAIEWLVTTIQNDATVISLGVTQAFMYSAPEKGVASFPYVIISKQAGSHTLSMCGVAYDSHFLAVKCVDYGFDGGERARKVIHRVRQIIEFQTATLASGRLIGITPVNSFEYDEQESGNNNFFHAVQVEKVMLANQGIIRKRTRKGHTMSDKTKSTPVSDKKPRTKYKALVDLEYNDTRVRAGEVTQDIPSVSVKWLLESNCIEEVA